jgi:hypothetical protein
MFCVGEVNVFFSEILAKIRTFRVTTLGGSGENLAATCGGPEKLVERRRELGFIFRELQKMLNPPVQSFSACLQFVALAPKRLLRKWSIWKTTLIKTKLPKQLPEITITSQKHPWLAHAVWKNFNTKKYDATSFLDFLRGDRNFER